MDGQNSQTPSYSAATGEYGFCRECGNVRPVLLPKGDRLQERLRQAFDKQAKADGIDVEEVAEQLMQLGIDEVKAFGFLDHPGPIRLEIALVAIMQAMIVVERKLERDLGRPVDLLRMATERIEETLEGDYE